MPWRRNRFRQKIIWSASDHDSRGHSPAALPSCRPEDFASARYSWQLCQPPGDQQAELVKAHLLDERPGFATSLVVVSTTKDMSAPNPLIQLNPAVRGAIEFLASRQVSHQVLVSLAHSLGFLNSSS